MLAIFTPYVKKKRPSVKEKSFKNSCFLSKFKNSCSEILLIEKF